MVLADQPLGLHITNIGHGLDGHKIFLQGKAAAGQDFFIAAGVEVIETARKLYFLAIQGDGAIGPLALGFGCFRNICKIHRQEPAHARFFVFQIAGGLSVRIVMDNVFLQTPEL